MIDAKPIVYTHMSSLTREELYNIEMLEKTQAAQAFLMYLENLEVDNSLKWVTFNVVSGQITSNAPWK